jgi:transcriptional regulator with XRE-family HTH domain
VTEGRGLRLRAIRQHWQLTLREVERRSQSFAKRWRNPSYQVSASWLDRLEREEHDLTVNKLIALSQIYNVPAEQLLCSMHPERSQLVPLNEYSSPNATMLLGEGPLDQRAKYMLPDEFGPDKVPDETTLLCAEYPALAGPHKRGLIGKRDRTMDPMIPAGSMVYIDTRKRGILARKDWVHEFQRPIYFLMTRESYACGWCELDRDSEWLTIISHPLSPVPSRRWRYRKEIESIGRVTFVAMRLSE